MAAIKINKDKFKEEVLDYQGVVFVDFYADWCGPCQMVGPIIDQLADELTSVKFVKINVDQNPDLATEYSIFSIPTFLIFKDGQVVRQMVGVVGKETLLDELKKIL